ncbi:MAG: 2-amino-4-hydroxy-6-hydroxymethyldihydropteridine diphosphokinase [Blautia sp.]|uniref:2-amino-4-hydroxy-6- hydroxymethyldihydropteridine diphosphokinase n=1 Tax=Blautia sp. TaxID=1955243 RepID=UPI002A762CDE|nr:2-amino-4-hydroxy-6-hydroxymethyldihydropteridine diphosphokinase [Blautia sp.]MDY3016659.1 2-amino-4-hydroxy-6-hydroxymethyldihydropteridine diphosphokinase [Blautia sp.]
MDKITIDKLEIFANHGVYPEENVLGQKFIISVVLYTSTRKASVTDELSFSVNYGEVSHFIRKYMTEHTWKLLECAAEHLAQAILLEYPLVKKLDLEIQKPWAPIGLPLNTVSVKITRGWHTAYIALGSNIGDKKAYLDMAVKHLNERKDCQVKKVSDYLVTEPYGVTDQDDFLNGALELQTMLDPEELLQALHQIEQDANRVRTMHWGPRTLDLDILMYDDLVLDTPELHIPHIEMHLRDFVLIPMDQIAPWKRHPLTGKTVEEMLQNLKSNDK